MMIGEFVFSSIGSTPVAGLADDDGAIVLATFFGFARVADELVVVAGLGVNGAGVISSGVAAAVLSKQACEVHPSNIACGEFRQLQPARMTDRVPTTSVLMPFPLQVQSSARISCERLIANDRCDRFSTSQRMVRT
jgi:hypothetical protein